MEPFIGAVVVYNHPGRTEGEHYQQSPAIVQKVDTDGTCDLWVFGPLGIEKDNRTIQGDGPCNWNWPVQRT